MAVRLPKRLTFCNKSLITFSDLYLGTLTDSQRWIGNIYPRNMDNVLTSEENTRRDEQ